VNKYSIAKTAIMAKQITEIELMLQLVMGRRPCKVPKEADKAMQGKPDNKPGPKMAEKGNKELFQLINKWSELQITVPL